MAALPLNPRRITLARCLAGLLIGRSVVLCLVAFSAIAPAAYAGVPDALSYQRLDTALKVYRSIEQDGGWAPVPPGPPLSVGSRDARVTSIRDRLRSTGDFNGEVRADAFFFGAALDQAVRRFQQRHGFVASGIVNERTQAAMNVSVADRIRQLNIVRNRWQQLPDDLGGKYVWVNTSAATIEIFERGQPLLSMRTIVGHPSRPTPSMHSEITQLIFNPPWVVPTTIAIEDLAPRQHSDPGYLGRSHIRVYEGWSEDARELDPADVDWGSIRPGHFPYRLRQDPGPWNSLGRVKVVFANDEDIFVHDTNSKFLFDLPVRNFSSGCVRLENAALFVEVLMRHESGWDEARIQRLTEHDRTQYVQLAEPVPIYLVYMTSWVTPNGIVHFRRDVYGADESAVSLATN